MATSASTIDSTLAEVLTEEHVEEPWDGWLLVVVCGLLGLGLVMIYSASVITAHWQYNDSWFFVKKQLVYMFAGFVLLYTGMQVDYRWYKRAIYPILALTIGLLVVVVLAGTTQNNAQRWINFGLFSFQPAEWTKIAMVMFMSYSVAKKGDKVKSFTVGMLPHLFVVGIVVGLLLLQPDFGTSVICISLMFAILFVAGTRISYILLAVGGAGAFAYTMITSSAYRMARVTAFLDPFQHESGSGYQLVKSMVAIGSGGIAGRGLGDGHGKLGFVPELETDFIGAAIAEELGFFGIGLIIVLYLLLVWRGARIALRANDKFGTYMATGLTFLFGLQAAINLGVISGMLPTKGLTLPFISYGGSSLLCSMFAIGIMLNVSRCADDMWQRKRRLKQARKDADRWERKRERIAKRRLSERHI